VLLEAGVAARRLLGRVEGDGRPTSPSSSPRLASATSVSPSQRRSPSKRIGVSSGGGERSVISAGSPTSSASTPHV
jgi:hypothetical protein